MLTIDFDRLGIGPGTRVLDLGCGMGRHSHEALRRGAAVTAADLDRKALEHVEAVATAMHEAGEVTAGGSLEVAVANALDLQFTDNSFDVVIVSEVFEHIQEDQAGMAEVRRVLRPGGVGAVTVPRYLPEAVCWLISTEYHSNEGGHVRIYQGDVLRQRLRHAGLSVSGSAHAHALHSPYWWVKCAVGVRRDEALPARLYHRFLVYDMMRRPAWSRALEAALNPLLGKSLVVYVEKPLEVTATAPPRRRRAAA
ncbi:MAG TPA: class I SAM-dependent methyltransferase [Candidatus Dormibacteraeota bacterium]|nr:class I SAM-dependent methyltransferase [Candidatus Dormibacteraeota bacterium]